jgi:hypothetical protein
MATSRGVEKHTLSGSDSERKFERKHLWCKACGIRHGHHASALPDFDVFDLVLGLASKQSRFFCIPRIFHPIARRALEVLACGA